MASLLNLLTDFSGSSNSLSQINIDSGKVGQDTDFNALISKFLQSGESGIESLTALMQEITGGAGLPAQSGNGGNALPPALSLEGVEGDAAVALWAQATVPVSLDASVISTQFTVAIDSELAQPAVNQPPTSIVALGTTPQNIEVAVTAAVQQSAIDTDISAPAAVLPAQPRLRGAGDAVMQGSVESSGKIPAALAGAGAVLSPLVASEELASPVAQQTLAAQELEQGPGQTTAATPTTDAVTLAPTNTVPTTLAARTEVPATTVAQAGVALSDDARLQQSGTAPITSPNSPNSPNSSTVLQAGAASQVPTGPAVVGGEPQALLSSQNGTTPLPLETTLNGGDIDDGADAESPTQLPRQLSVPAGPPLRPMPASATAQPNADANFAAVATMLNQGQTMGNLNERLQFMLLNGQNSAEIQLDPPELGSLQVRVSTRNEQTAVVFVAPNNVVRDALEQQLPRLRETLENAGLQLQDASVFAQTDDKAGAQRDAYADSTGDESIDDTLDEDGGDTSRVIRSVMRLVDAYI